MGKYKTWDEWKRANNWRPSTAETDEEEKLIKLIDDAENRLADRQNERAQLEEDLDTVMDEIDRLEDRIVLLEAKLNKVRDESDTVKFDPIVTLHIRPG